MALDIPFDNSYARMPPRLYARTEPVAVAGPRLIAVNEGLAAELGLDAAALRTPDGVAVLAGNAVAAGSEPMALAYAGHQFGGWVPQLGDGRAHLLGEVVDRAGRRRDIQLKGSGRTPFSRGGDGRAWLGPVLREYLVSEAMHALGVPTTRALAAVETGERVQRERAFPGAVLTRVAASHIRVGTFQYFAARRDLEALEALKDHVIARHYPDVAGADDEAMALFGAVVAAQARLIAKWMGLGFIHGVMNTDNTSVSGETIDYGPCAFMDTYQAGKVFSSIDAHGRYAYSNQPHVVVWNLAQLGSSLLPLMLGGQEAAAERATEVLQGFGGLYEAEWAGVARAKLGLGGAEPGDLGLMQDFLAAMEDGQADFTNAFRGLGDATARDWFTDPGRYDAWAPRWEARRARGSDAAAMARANPAAIPRNHRIEEAIQAALTGDFGPFERLSRVLARPFELAEGDAELALPPEPDQEVTMTFCGT